MKLYRAVLFALLGCFWCPLYAAAIPASSTFPLDSWVYPALDKLSALGLVDSSLPGTRPFTRYEVARQVREAAAASPSESAPVVVNELLRQLQDELAPELTADSVGQSYFKPVRKAEIGLRYQDSQPSRYPVTNATQVALNTNNYGIDYANGGNLDVRLKGDARLGKRLQFEWRPQLQGAEGDVDLHLLQGRAALQLGAFEISAGRQSLWWGQGRHGALLLSDNARSLDMLRVTNPTPSRLPWIFKYLGPFRFDLFWSRLENNRVVPHPYLSGLRLDFKPVPWFEIGAARTIMYGGKGRPSLDLGDYITILGGHNLTNNDTSNSLAALDWRIKLPLWHSEFYGEFGGEDENSSFFTKDAAIFGLYLPGIDPVQRIGLRLEYADLNLESIGPVWYGHSTYRSGYTYHAKILGHQVTGDSQDYYAAFDWYINPDLQTMISVDFEKRGDSRPIREKHLQPGLQLRWYYTDNAALKAEVYYDRVQNADFVAGNDRNDYLAGLSLDLTF